MVSTSIYQWLLGATFLLRSTRPPAKPRPRRLARLVVAENRRFSEWRESSNHAPRSPLGVAFGTASRQRAVARWRPRAVAHGAAVRIRKLPPVVLATRGPVGPLAARADHMDERPGRAPPGLYGPQPSVHARL